MDWNTIYSVTKPAIAGQLRTFLAGLAGYLAAQHVIPGDQKSAFVTIGMSVLSYGVAALWSLVSKWWEAQKVKKALMTPAPRMPVTVGEAAAIVANAPPVPSAK